MVRVDESLKNTLFMHMFVCQCPNIVSVVPLPLCFSLILFLSDSVSRLSRSVSLDLRSPLAPRLDLDLGHWDRD